MAADTVLVENSEPVWSHPCTQIESCGQLVLKRLDNLSGRASVIPGNESDTGSRASFSDAISEFLDVQKAIPGREIRVVDDPVRPRKRTLRKADPAMAQKEQKRHQSGKALSDIEISLMLCRGIEHRRRGCYKEIQAGKPELCEQAATPLP